MKRTKIFTYALVLLLTLALVGCGSNGSAPAGSASEDSDVIKIGGVFELTGEVAEFGKKGDNGVRLAIKEINEKGGVLGKQIQYISADNKSEAGESTAAATKLIDQDKVIGIVGPMTTGNTLAVIPVVTDYGIPLAI